MFLAVSIGLATAYLAFVSKMHPLDRPTLYGSQAEDIWQRTNFMARYARAIVLQRAPLLRAAVVSLAFGVLLLPIALVQVPVTQSTSDETVAIAWPSAPAIEPKEVAVVLYQHQLDEFVKTIDTKKATSSKAEDEVALVIAVIGLILVWATATNRLWKDSDSDPDGTVVVAPAATPRQTDPTEAHWVQPSKRCICCVRRTAKSVLRAHPAGAQDRDGQKPQKPEAGSSIRVGAPSGRNLVTMTTTSVVPSLRPTWTSVPSSIRASPACFTSGVQVGSSP